MAERRIVGIDLGIATEHTAVVLREDGTVVTKRRCRPTVPSLQMLERAVLDGAPQATTLEIVIEPTGPAWLPIAVFFGRRGHGVHRVPSAKAADLRRILSRHAKSNGIDADTLARIAIVDPDGLYPVELPDRARASLDRRVRATARLTRQAATHKRRIRDLVRQLMPCPPLGPELTKSDLAVLERHADPNALLRLGRARLTTLLRRVSRNHLGADRATRWIEAAREAVDLYGGDGAVAFEDLAEEVTTEVRLLRVVQAELERHEGSREQAYRTVDPGQLARSVPGLAKVGRRRWSRRSAERIGSAVPSGSSPSPASCPGSRRPGSPIERASR